MVAMVSDGRRNVRDGSLYMNLCRNGNFQLLTYNKDNAPTLHGPQSRPSALDLHTLARLLVTQV